jgi:hypothetical protein
VALGAVAGAAPAKFRPAGGHGRPGAGGGRPAGPWGSVSGLGRFRTTAGGAARRRRGGPTAGACALANGRRGLADTRAGGVEYVLGRVSGRLHDADDERNRGYVGGL